jgi:hypothetical protein
MLGGKNSRVDGLHFGRSFGRICWRARCVGKEAEGVNVFGLTNLGQNFGVVNVSSSGLRCKIKNNVQIPYLPF